MFIITTLVMYALLIPCVALYIRIKHKGSGKDDAAVIIKGMCTTIILAAAMFAASDAPEAYLTYALLIVAGLALGLAGDVAICNNFLAGMAFFALGHICYIPALLTVSVNPLWALPAFIVIGVITFFLYRLSKIKTGKYTVPAIVYSSIIAVMLSLAVSVPIGAPNAPVSWIILAGAFLFTLSDILLANNVFSRKGTRLRMAVANRSGSISTFCYFIGQSLIALSIFCL